MRPNFIRQMLRKRDLRPPSARQNFWTHLEARDVAMGRLAGLQRAEGFETKRPPAVDDLGHLG
jgi:hypothetical protein